MVTYERLHYYHKIKRKNTACGKIIQGYHPDEVLAKLEKYIKQYDLYAYLLDEQQHIVFKRNQRYGIFKSSLDALIKRDTLKNMMQKLIEIHLQIACLNKKLNKTHYRTATCV